MDVDQFKKDVKSHFNNAVRAVSEEQDFDFYAIVQVLGQEGENIKARLYPNPMKDFSFEITGVEVNGDEWIVQTPRQRWAWRTIPQPDLKEYRADMKKAGVDVD